MKQGILIISGLILTVGAAGGVTELPPTATIQDWVFLCGVAVLGALAMFAGVEIKE